MTKDELKNFMIWSYYNHRLVDIMLDDLDKISSEFIEATSKEGKYCQCIEKSHSTNWFWTEWHCTYCLKPKELKDGRVVYK